MRRALLHWFGNVVPTLEQIPVGAWAEKNEGEGWAIYKMIEDKKSVPLVFSREGKNA